jgi:hypothetical protein
MVYPYGLLGVKVQAFYNAIINMHPVLSVLQFSGVNRLIMYSPDDGFNS